MVDGVQQLIDHTTSHALASSDSKPRPTNKLIVSSLTRCHSNISTHRRKGTS